MKIGNHSGVEFNNPRSKPGAIHEDGEFDKCVFTGGVLSLASETEDFDAAKRCTIRRVTATRCKVRSPLIGPAIFEDVTIDRLDTEGGPVFIRGAAFKHVTLKGNIGSIMIWAGATQMPVEHINRAVMKANLDYYKNVDWALDIREVRAKELSVTSVPVDLVRYDPEHQAVVRLNTIRKRWKEIKEETDGHLFGYALARLREQPYCDGVVLCVPLRAKKDCVAELASLIKRLRKLGIAESP